MLPNAQEQNRTMVIISFPVRNDDRALTIYEFDARTKVEHKDDGSSSQTKSNGDRRSWKNT